MNSRIRIVLAGLACAALCAVSSAQNAGAPAAYPSPAGDSPISGPAPSQGHVWMSGHWNSEGGQWKWAAAHWELPPSRSAIWVVGHWAPSGGNWVWVNGAWNISDDAQAQAGPPVPPGMLAESAQGGPTPTTSAPYVDGQFQAQYAPGGVVRQAYPVAGTTDYGPSDSYPAYDYSAYGYPAYGYAGYGYGWAGYPVYWGLPGVELGFGWGPGFRSWGRGGYGYGHGGGRGYGGHGPGGHGPGGHGSGGQTHFSHGGSGHFGH